MLALQAGWGGGGGGGIRNSDVTNLNFLSQGISKRELCVVPLHKKSFSVPFKVKVHGIFECSLYS